MAISLEKGKKVNLRKQEKAGLGEILVNLNWNSKLPRRGFWVASSAAETSPSTWIWAACTS